MEQKRKFTISSNTKENVVKVPVQWEEKSVKDGETATQLC